LRIKRARFSKWQPHHNTLSPSKNEKKINYLTAMEGWRHKLLMGLLMLVFWVVMPCGFVGRYKRFGGHTASIFSPEEYYFKYFISV
jgi:hypothetical protein